MTRGADQLREPSPFPVPTARDSRLVDSLVIVDGLPGCGKTLISSVIAALDRVELLMYAYEIEHVCALDFLKDMDSDAAANLVAMQADLRLYNVMMGREVNFRPTDLSSAERSPDPDRYRLRLEDPGDEAVPGRVAVEKPILHLTTHQLLPYAGPVFAAFGERLVYVDVVRHPLYMLRQESLNMTRLNNDVRDFQVYLRHGDRSMPFWTHGWEDLFLRSNDTEKAVHFIDQVGGLERRVLEDTLAHNGAKVVVVPFERFVIDPDPYLLEIAGDLDSEVTDMTMRVMAEQNVPRAKWADGVGLDIYRRCGWEPPREDLDERGELEVRRRFASETAGPEAMRVLDRLCDEYEERYLDGRMRQGLQYV